MVEKQVIRDQIHAAYTRVFNAYNQALKDLEEIVKNAGGFIKTLPSSDRPILNATMEDYSGNQYTENIYGIRYIEGEGLFLCTRSCLSNYEFDNSYDFEYTYDFVEGTEDMENIEKLVNDPAYYIDIYEDYVDTNETVYEILAGLDSYIED